METKQIKITKEILEKAHKEHFNKEAFLSVDPCGLVYELKSIPTGNWTLNWEPCSWP